MQRHPIIVISKENSSILEEEKKWQVKKRDTKYLANNMSLLNIFEYLPLNYFLKNICPCGCSLCNSVCLSNTRVIHKTVGRLNLNYDLYFCRQSSLRQKPFCIVLKVANHYRVSMYLSILLEFIYSSFDNYYLFYVLSKTLQQKY